MVTTDVGHWNHRARLGERLVCCACGIGCVGSKADVERARKADEAWRKHKADGE